MPDQDRISNPSVPLSGTSIQIRELVRGSGMAFLLRVAGAGIAVAVQIVVARHLDEREFGEFSFVLAVVGVLALVARLGLGTTAIRFQGQYRAQGDRSRAVGMVIFAVSTVLLTAVVIAAVGHTMVEFLSHRLHPSRLETLSWGSLLLIPLSLIGLMQSLLYSCKRLTMAVFGEQILRPLAMVGTLLILFAARPEPATARDAIVADTIAAGLVIAVYTLALALAMGRDVLVARPRFEVRTWLGVSLPLFLMAGMQVLFNQTDIIMLGILDTPEVTGAYAAAGRIARLVLFGLTAMSSVLAPMIAEAYHGNRLEQLDSVLRYSARILAVFTIVVTLALAFGGGFVLGLFGESFRVAWGPLVVLLVGQGINSCAGPVAYLLTLTGHHRTAAVIAGTCSLANIVLNAVLIPIWGIWGAAAATAVSVAAWNLWMLVAARRAVGVNPSAFRRSWS